MCPGCDLASDPVTVVTACPGTMMRIKLRNIVPHQCSVTGTDVNFDHTMNSGTGDEADMCLQSVTWLTLSTQEILLSACI